MFEQLRQQISTLWGNQSRTQRVALVAILASGMILIVFFLVWAGNPSYSVAFSGLSESDAGLIVEQLTEQGIPYELRGAGTILVPSDQVYEVRLQMARDGLPEGGTVGYELFSGNMLGMTDFTQRINYQRALEGELERTILSLSAVNEVWVHIVTPEKSLLESDQNPTTASVTVEWSPFPARMIQGTPAQRHESSSSLTAANVSVSESAETPDSSRYPRYCPRTTASGGGATIALKALARSSRNESGS